MKPKWFLFAVGGLFLIGVLGLYNLSLRPALPAEIIAGPGGLYSDSRLIAAIDKQPISKHSHLIDLIDTRRIGDRVTLTYADGAEERIELGRHHSAGEVVFYGGVGLLFFALSTIVALNQKSRSGDDMAISGYCWGFVLMVAWQGMQLPALLSGLVNLVYFICYPQACIYLLLFALQFPDSRLSSGVRKRFMIALLSVGLVFTLVLLILFFRKAADPSPQRISDFRAGYGAFYVFILVTVLASLVAIVRNTYRHSNPVTHRKLLWVIAGLLAGILPFVLLWVVPLLLGGRPVISNEAITLFASLIPISIAVAILKYRLFNIEILLSRSLVYGTVISLLAGLYLLLLTVLSSLLYEQFPVDSRTLSIFAAILVALVFSPIKSRVQTFVDRKFFRIRYDRFRSIQAFVQDLEHCNEEIQMLNVLDLHFQNSVPLQQNLFAKKTDDRWSDLVTGELVEPALGDWLDRNGRARQAEILVNIALRDRVEADLECATDDLPAPWVILVAIASEVFWFMSAKRAGSRFWQEDLDLALQMAQETTLHWERLGYMRKALSESLEKEKAQKESQWKSMLVAEVAHDLRAPLNTMLWKLRNLQSSIPGQQQDADGHFLEVQQQVHKLQTFVQNLLMLAQKEQDKLAIKFVPVSIKRTCEEVIANLQSILTHKKLTVEVECHDGLQIHGDGFMLQEIIMNIVENAAKYSPESSTISISAVDAASENPKAVLIAIRDQGHGIPKPILENVASPFADHEDPDDQKGFSLGLYIVHQFTALLNGEIEIHSEASHGTTFELRFEKGKES